MSIIPTRDLDKFGVVTDVDPFDLPIGAWSMAVNARFFDGRIQRGPVFRNGGALVAATPRMVKVFDNPAGYDTVFVGYLNGRVYARSSGSETDFSIAAYATSSVEDTWSAFALGSCFYVNRADRVPWVLMPAASQFVALGGGWDATWRAEILRTYNNALVAFNVTKAGTAYPTLVKTSDIVDDIGIIPTTWDHTDPTNNATENPLAEMNSAIIDANRLGQAMIIYGKNEAWVMQADGSEFVYSYRRLPFSLGAINANCSIEVNNQHFVFGPNDIWTHDGTSHKSIADGRVRKYIFSSLHPSHSDRCFVAHNENLKEISFCYYSGDSRVLWSSNGCNRSAVYNYQDDKWTFDDLPLVFGASMANTDLTQTWNASTATWETIGATWQDQEAGFKRVLCFVGETYSAAGLTASIYPQDLYGSNSLSSAAVSTTASPTMILERDGIDLDELGEKLSGYKHILAVLPEGRIEVGGTLPEFCFGSADYFSLAAEYSEWQTYDPYGENYKLDYTSGGRFLAMKMRFRDYKTFSLSGLDFDLVSTGER